MSGFVSSVHMMPCGPRRKKSPQESPTIVILMLFDLIDGYFAGEDGENQSKLFGILRRYEEPIRLQGVPLRFCVSSHFVFMLVSIS